MLKIIKINNIETNYSVSDEGYVINNKTKKRMKGTLTAEGYKRVQLTLPDKKLKTCLVHRLVAEAFCENSNNYKIVDHINRIKDDNRAKNLRWTSLTENSLNIDIKAKSEKLKKPRKQNIEEFDFTSAITLRQNPKYLINKKGQILNIKLKRVMEGSYRSGYIRVEINHKIYSVHRLVWENFIGEIPDKMVIDHIDGDRSNNNLENLRCVAQSKNMDNVYRNGHRGMVKIKQYSSNGDYIATYDSIREAANAIGGSEIAIKDASLRYGLSSGYYWIRMDDDISIEEVLKRWVPEGFCVIPEYSSYCINMEGKVYNKYTARVQKEKYRADGKPFVLLQNKRINIEDLLNIVYGKE